MLEVVLYLVIGWTVLGLTTLINEEQYDSPIFCLFLTIILWPLPLMFWLILAIFETFNIFGNKYDTWKNR